MLLGMRHLAWLGLIACTVAAGATAYKSVGPDGKVTYTDRPTPNAKEVALPEPSTYAPPALPAGAGAPISGGGALSSGEYRGFAIAAPKNEETLHNRDRTVDVDLSLDPALQEGHTLSLVLDGAEIAKGLRKAQIRLTDVERGPHRLEAAIYAGDGREIERSPPIRFYVVTETLIKEPLEAQKDQLKKGDLGLESRVWDKWVQDLGGYQTKLGGDPLPKTAPPVPPIGNPPGGSAYKKALESYQRATDTFNSTHGTFQQPAVDPSAPYKPGFDAPASRSNPYVPPSKPPSYVPAPPARPPYAPAK
jgi:hypothetical protein